MRSEEKIKHKLRSLGLIGNDPLSEVERIFVERFMRLLKEKKDKEEKKET